MSAAVAFFGGCRRRSRSRIETKKSALKSSPATPAARGARSRRAMGRSGTVATCVANAAQSLAPGGRSALTTSLLNEPSLRRALHRSLTAFA
jgi:hypothetical protein